MSLTPNFGMNIPDASDIVNLLTQCYPNFTLLDTALQTIKETGVSTATESKVGTVHNIVRTVSDCAVFWFTATSNFTAGDTFTVDGVSVSAVKVSGAGLETGDFVINSNVPCIVKGGVLTVLAGGTGTPDASDVPYDNTGSGLTATDVQDAIDEVVADIPTGFSASAITYDNTGSGLTATNAQDAIDELASASAGETATVTANGVKTYKQILETLYPLIDASKITPNAVIVEDAGTFKNVCPVVRIDNTRYNFTRVYLSTTLDSMMFEVGSTSSFKQGTGNTISDASAVVPANGRTYKIIY